jgi:hypothetical protein
VYKLLVAILCKACHFLEISGSKMSHNLAGLKLSVAAGLFPHILMRLMIEVVCLNKLLCVHSVQSQVMSLFGLEWNQMLVIPQAKK